MELDLKNPIFIIYISVAGLSKQKANEEILKLKDLYKYDNATFWIIPLNESSSNRDTRVELIWNGSNYSISPGNPDKEGIKIMLENVNSILELIANGSDNEFIKSYIRDKQILDVLND